MGHFSAPPSLSFFLPTVETGSVATKRLEEMGGKSTSHEKRERESRKTKMKKNHCEEVQTYPGNRRKKPFRAIDRRTSHLISHKYHFLFKGSRKGR